MTEYPTSLPHQGRGPRKRGNSWLRDHPQAGRYKRLWRQMKFEGKPCVACGEAIDPGLKGPDPLSFSLDHQPALSVREKDEQGRPRDILTGVSPCHFGENSSKGNRGSSGDQAELDPREEGGEGQGEIGYEGEPEDQYQPWVGHYRLVSFKPDPDQARLDAGNQAYARARTKPTPRNSARGRFGGGGLSRDPVLMPADLRPEQAWPWLKVDDEGHPLFIVRQWRGGRRVYWLTVDDRAVADPNLRSQPQDRGEPEDGGIERSRRW